MSNPIVKINPNVILRDTPPVKLKVAEVLGAYLALSAPVAAAWADRVVKWQGPTGDDRVPLTCFSGAELMEAVGFYGDVVDGKTVKAHRKELRQMLLDNRRRDIEKRTQARMTPDRQIPSRTSGWGRSSNQPPATLVKHLLNGDLESAASVAESMGELGLRVIQAFQEGQRQVRNARH